MDNPTVERGRGKNKAFWNEAEVKALVDTLQELAADPLWKVDVVFRNNHMVEVHKRLLVKMPNFDKAADPHINSKIKWLRLKYNLISEMCMQSGCQWDDNDCKINCEKKWYDELCKTHKNDVGMWNFKFPYLRRLDMVWGKDRATGLKAEDIFEAAVDAYIPNKKTLYSSDEDECIMFSNERGSTSNASNIRASKKYKNISAIENFYKRKKTSLQETIDTKLDNFTDKFQSICDQMPLQYAAIMNALISEPKSKSLDDEKMQEAIKELVNLGVSPGDVGHAAEICYDDPAKVQVLFALPSHLRVSFVLVFLYPSSNL